LEERNNTVVTIDSTPPQTIVSKDGDYQFELGIGKYEIEAIYTDGQLIEKTTELVEIKKEGDFVLDLILFPSFEEEEELFQQTEEEVADLQEFSIINLIMFIVVIIGFGIIIYLVIKYSKQLQEVSKEVKGHKDIPDETKKVIAFIKKQGGRTTQKEIRKNFPSSEAKISLIISELEEEGIVKKIKKGRGNIIILK